MGGDRKATEAPSDWDRMESSITRVGLPELDGSERRQHSRHDIESKGLRVVFRTKGALARFYIRDISNGGMFVKTEMRPPLQSIIELSLEIPDEESGEPIDFIIKSKVARHGRDGIGLTFERADIESTRRLETFVKSVVLKENISLAPEKKEEVFRRHSEVQEIRKAKEAEQKVTLIRSIIIIGLIFLNLWAASQTETGENLINSVQSSKPQTPLQRVSTEIRRDPKSGQLTKKFFIGDGHLKTEVDPHSISPALKVTLDGAREFRPPPRRSKTAPDSRVRLR